MKKCAGHKPMRALDKCGILAFLLFLIIFAIPQQSLAATSIPDVNDTIFSSAIQADGKILIGGGFTKVNGVARTGIARLNGADGSLDASFNPAVENTNGTILYPVSVHAIAIQADGKVLIGGQFTSVNGAGGIGSGKPRYLLIFRLFRI